MARKCPNCFADVPKTSLLAYSNDLECPSCHSPLEPSNWSRNISAFAGLALAAVVWRVTTAHYSLRPSGLGWVLPVLFSYLAYSIVAPLVLVLTGDLRLKSSEPVASTVEAPRAHDVSH
jgi:hypothetical protein